MPFRPFSYAEQNKPCLELGTTSLVNEHVNVLGTLSDALCRTIPTEESQQYRPTLDNSALEALLDAARAGQVPRTPQATDNIDMSEAAVQMRNHDAIRRHAIVTLRNISQTASLRAQIIACPSLLDQVLAIFSNANETGLVCLCRLMMMMLMMMMMSNGATSRVEKAMNSRATHCNTGTALCRYHSALHSDRRRSHQSTRFGSRCARSSTSQSSSRISHW